MSVDMPSYPVETLRSHPRRMNAVLDLSSLASTMAESLDGQGRNTAHNHEVC